MTYAYTSYSDAPRWYETWPGRIAIAAVIAIVGAWAWQSCSAWVVEGQRVRDAMPPSVVARHDHYTTSQTYSCGNNCVTTSNSDHFNLYDRDGRVCSVSERQWAAAPDGQPFKCPEIYGWQRP